MIFDLADEVHILPRMAEVVRVVKQQAVEPGMIQCRAPGCDNWFHKRSGRHVYCKAEDCTYRRGAPPAAELVSPEGAAEEMLRRLQESDEAEVGPAMLVDRFRAMANALRAADADAYWGACVDLAAGAVWAADRAKRGELPKSERPQLRGPQPGTSQRPVGLVHAVLASHHRTYVLGEQRVELVYELLAAREHALACEAALAKTAGHSGDEEAREVHRVARVRLERAERALQSVEAAWRERGTSLEQLEQAAAAGQSPGPGSNGGARRGEAAATT